MQGAAARADPGQQMQRRRRRQPRRRVVKLFDGGAETRRLLRTCGKKRAGDPFGKARAFLLQEDQQRDARHRQQQHRHHRLGQRPAAWQMAELRNAQRQAEGQERHLRHRFGGGVGGNRGGGIAGVHALQDHQPRRRDHAADGRERRNLGDGIAHQPGEIKFAQAAGARAAAAGKTRPAPAPRTPPRHRGRAAPGRRSRRARWLANTASKPMAQTR